MLVTVNGEYTKEFLVCFTKHYLGDWEGFCQFCERHHLTNDEAVHLANYVNNAGGDPDKISPP